MQEVYCHVSQSYGISESSCYKGIKWIEDTLIKHPDFALPGRKALLRSDMEYEVILIDTTETPIDLFPNSTPDGNCGDAVDAQVLTYFMYAAALCFLHSSHLLLIERVSKEVY
ncbi:IS5 family transposase domain protein [Rickettsiales endosymbiont of Paramecium tredecaurelia]|nr:IS5 family transposase domain protein [Candidatus Sarmatiella mevalonica]